jgi:hypothetical protein
MSDAFLIQDNSRGGVMNREYSDFNVKQRKLKIEKEEGNFRAHNRRQKQWDIVDVALAIFLWLCGLAGIYFIYKAAAYVVG